MHRLQTRWGEPDWLTRARNLAGPGCAIKLDRQVMACLLSTVSDVFEALAAPARRAIVDELAERDGQTLFEICARLAMKHQIGLTRQAVSQHLEVLKSAGLVRAVRQGKYKLHYLDTEPIRTVVARWLKTEKKGRQ